MWLVANDLEEYAEEFSNKNIDGKQLLNLDGSRLKVQLYTPPLGPHPFSPQTHSQYDT